jgi:hypothetical protein
MTKIYKCRTCQKIHLEAGNVLIHFPSWGQLRKYLNYLESIDVSYYVATNRKKGLAKDIFLPVDGGMVNIAFSLDEFEEMKTVIHSYLLENRKYIDLNEFKVISWN